MHPLPQKDFSKSGPLIDPVNLNEVQLNSYDRFLKEGIKELLKDSSPIVDTKKEIELYFEEYRFGEPKYDPDVARYKDSTYEAPLYIQVRLVDKKFNRTEKQEVYFGEVPMMTERGTFIVNGVERVVVSQLVRSSGVYFTADTFKGRKLFGAKVIPTRGSWLEFETDSSFSIGVKIDRHRKVAVTDLLRIFDANKKEIKEAFTKHEKESKHLNATLKKDFAEDTPESYMEIYKRLRPGDPVTAVTAKGLIDSMFHRGDRYDLSSVGRYKLNQRLGFTKRVRKNDRLLGKNDILAIVSEIVRLNNDSNANPDDIDNLGNRRVKGVGELLEARIRVGFARLRRIVQDGMSTKERENLAPVQLINYRPITGVIRQFFTSSQLSQFMDQVNPLAEIEHKRRLSALGPGGVTRERATFEVRDVHRSHYGRICPIETPEGANIGLLNHLATFARVNDMGFLETPYAKVRNGRIIKEIVWLDAVEEERFKIVHSGTLKDPKTKKLIGPMVEARVQGTPGTCRVDEVDLIEVAPHQFVSLASSLIPFLQHDDANRALMGSNMQRQAVPSIKPSAPYVGTGQEDRVAADSGYVISAEGAGTVMAVDGDHIDVKYGKKKPKTYKLSAFKRSNQSTAIIEQPLVFPGDKVKKGDVLTSGSSVDHGVLALGQNLLVAFMSWEGANFEDAIILSERVARDDLFTSVHIEDFYCDVRDTKLGPEITTPDIPNVSEERLRNLDEEGVIRIGAEVGAGDILVGKISPRGEAELTAEERLLRAIFGEKARDVKDTSLNVPHGKRGRVVGVKIFSRDSGDKLDAGIIKRIQIEVASLRKVQAGDKLAGRHGNKGVISQVRPVEDMPYMEDGTPIDIILNPLGIASRMNLGQVLETHLGLAAKKLGYRAVTPSFDSVSEEIIRKELKIAGYPEDGKHDLYDGRSGDRFDNRVAVGQIYMMKLNHMVEDKVHMRSIGPYSLITQQPLGGKAQFGGQRFGEMEVWALEGYGARHTLQEMITIKSDDVMGRSSAYESIIRQEEIREPNVPASFDVLVNELKSLCLNVEQVYEENDDEFMASSDARNFSGLKLSIAPPSLISGDAREGKGWSYGEVIKPETINYRTQRPEKDGLFSERIFGPTKDFECYCGKYRKVRYKGVVCDKCGVEVTKSAVRRERLAHISLASPVAHIWFLKSIPSPLSLLLDVSAPKIERVIYYVDYIVTEVNEERKVASMDLLDKELSKKLKEVGKENSEMREELKKSVDRLKKRLKEISVGTTLKEDEYFSLSRKFGDVFNAGSGAPSIRSILEKIDLKKEIVNIRKEIEKSKNKLGKIKALKRLKMMRSMSRNGIKPEWIIIKELPVIPPDLRPMVALDGGRYATSDLNDLYRRVLNRNNRLKRLLEIRAPDIIVRNEKRMLQESVDALIDNSARFGTQQLSSQRRPLRSLADMLKGKQGRFRQNLLGKRVDYSGRSVIVVGPKLDIGECGIPKKMALELFRPFVIGEMIKRGIVHNIKMAGRVIEEGGDEVWEILEEVIQGRHVILNRAPTLHRLSVQAFKPLLIEGLAIQVPPLVCAAFNADFDGDQMAVHVPLSKLARKEAKEIMFAEKNILKPATGDLIAGLTQDAVLGTYYLTRENFVPEGKDGSLKSFASVDEAKHAYEGKLITLHEKIEISGRESSLGRFIFNVSLGGSVPFVDNVMTKKEVRRVVESVFERHGLDRAREVLDELKLLGFEFATRSGITWSMADLVIPKEKTKIVHGADDSVREIQGQFQSGLLTSSEKTARIIDVWTKVKSEIDDFVTKALPIDNSIYQITDSGARGSWLQPSQMMGMRGLVSNPKGETIELPIRASFKEGLSVLEYFISTHGARKGTTDTALKTAQAGYLTRRLVDVSQDLIIREMNCRTTKGIMVRRGSGKEFGQTFAGQVFSRTSLEDIKKGRKILVKSGEIIDKITSEAIEKTGIDEIKVRSPLTCKTIYGICAACYGLDLGHNTPTKIGSAVGVVAAQSIGEPGTQLTMRTFHTGGVAGIDITHGLPRVEELFEARPPKGRAILADADGEIEKIEEKGPNKLITLKVTGEIKGKKKGKVLRKGGLPRIEYTAPKRTLVFVKKGESISSGQRITEGNIDLKELMRYRGSEEAMKHIITEVQKIYMGEGESIHNKHIEIIVRQMFSRVKIVDEGDSDEFIIGEIVEKSKFLEVNRKMRREGKTRAKAKQLLMGVTRVALSTHSFLSAASFQDTSRVLVAAAVEGRVDTLRGLKENVIIGRLIPAGAIEEDLDKSV